MRGLSQAELRQISGVEICVFSACRYPQAAMDWREMIGVASTRLRQRNIASHNTQYVNKPLIYIINMGNVFIPPGAKSVKIYSDGDLICGEKLIDGVE
jgi:hypothetical protein